MRKMRKHGGAAMATAAVFVALIMLLTSSGYVHAAGAYTNNTGNGYVKASGGASCSITDLGTGWTKWYDDGTLSKYIMSIHFASYSTITHVVGYDLHAPGWFDEADMYWTVYQWNPSTNSWTTKEGPHRISTGGDATGTQQSASYSIGTQTWRVDISVYGYDWGSQTCYKTAQFSLSNS